MLLKLSDQVRECYARAEECGRKAEDAFTEALRQDMLRLQASWLNLARSYEFAERLLDFSNEKKHRREKSYGKAHH
jgi:hypothetical protein